MARTQTKEQTPDLLDKVAPQPQAEKPVKKSEVTKAKPKGTEIAKVEQLPARPASVLEIIGRAALDPRVDPAKMQALLNMKKEIEADESKKAFTADFIALQNVLPIIDAKGRIVVREKDGQGKRTGAKQQDTPYATFNEIHRVTKPLLKAHGFAISFATEPMGSGERLVIKGLLEHIGGHQRETAFPLPAESSGSKNNAQAWGSAFSYGKRYCTIALLNIVSHAPEDADDDAAATTPKKNDAKAKDVVAETSNQPDPNATINGSQAKELIKVINDCGVEFAVFMEKYKIAAAHELLASQYDEAIKNCKDYAARKKAAEKAQ